MIERVLVKGYRILRDFEWEPHDGINILVGDNASGKSTVLDAIELALSCRVNGRRASDELSPYWFNAEDVKEFFASIETGAGMAYPPSILVELYLRPDSGDVSRTRGAHNSKGADAAGLKLEIRVDKELLGEFYKTCREEGPSGKVLPVEYYTLKWSIFEGQTIKRIPDGIACARIDAVPRTSFRSADGLARSVVDENLSQDEIRGVSTRYRLLRQRIDRDVLSDMLGASTDDGLSGDIGFQMDQSMLSDWRNDIVLQQGGIPLSQAGRGVQVETKAYFALKKSEASKVLLMEEPENHLSHTTLMRVLGMIGDKLEGRQLFVTTHSAFVLNRLGLDRLALMCDGRRPACIEGLSKDTVSYFKKQSGVETLRLVLADRVAVVEGPSDEMVFNWAYRKRFGKEPREDGIDVIAYGTRGKRALELAKALGRDRMAVLRDNDGKDASKWTGDASAFLEEGKREMFVGETALGKTLEPQMVSANSKNLELLRTVLGLSSTGAKAMADEMKGDKTEWAWALASCDAEKSNTLQAPKYISDAIEFIHPHE